MLLNLTELSTEPLHNQISRQIWEKVLAEDLKAGEELLHARTLARTHHISSLTVNRAYGDLQKEGIIKSDNGTVYFVENLTEERKREIARRRLFEVNSPLNVIDTFSNQLFSVFDPEKLRQILEDNILSFIRVKNVFMALRENKSKELEILPERSYPQSFKIEDNDPFLDEICRLSLPAHLNEIDKSSGKSKLNTELKRRNVQILFPLKEKDTVHGFIALTEKEGSLPFLKEDTGVLTVLANQFVTALITARFYVEAIEKRRMEEEINLARQIQRDLLPHELPDNDSIQLAAVTEPSLTVGGDFYDYLPLDENRFGLVIADACGKGMPAAMLISQIQAILKSEAGQGNSIQQTMINLNKHIKQYTSSQNFTTLFYGIYDKEAGVLEYANAGHNYPVLLRKNGETEPLTTTGAALGILPGGEGLTQVINLYPGDSVILYSDGVTETMNENMKEYGEQRLQDLLISCRDLSPEKIIEEILGDLNSFSKTEQLQDDRTLMVLKVL